VWGRHLGESRRSLLTERSQKKESGGWQQQSDREGRKSLFL